MNENQTKKVSPEEIARIKGLGFLSDKRYDGIFNVRVVTRSGRLNTDEHRAVAEAADKFGNGEVALTTRQSFEIQGVPYENTDALISFLAEHGLETGGTGPLVRPIVSCKGATCRFGLLDSVSLGNAIHERFYRGLHDVKLPHKFKIAVGGCPNNCVKPDLNDVGIIGQRVMHYDLEKCRGCAKCAVEAACPVHNAKVENGKLSVDFDSCNHCGRCLNKCPFGVAQNHVDGYKVCIGGRFGKQIAFGKQLHKLFTSEEEVLDIIEKCISLFREEGITGERFADTIDRLGFDYVESKLLGK